MFPGQQYLSMIGFGTATSRGEHIKVVGTTIVERSEIPLDGSEMPLDESKA